MFLLLQSGISLPGTYLPGGTTYHEAEGFGWEGRGGPIIIYL
jgi:hypothetical protein